MALKDGLRISNRLRLLHRSILEREDGRIATIQYSSEENILREKRDHSVEIQFLFQ